MNSLDRLKQAMQTETTIAAITKRAKVSKVMVQAHLPEQPPQKRLIVLKPEN